MGKVAGLIEQLNWIRKCAIEAGIWDHVFLAFGSCLGAVREGGFIPHDDDADVGILSDNISKEQEDNFYNLLWKYKLFEERHREQRRTDSGRLLWTSLKMKGNGYKTCIWYMYNWQDMLWHSKGSDWVEKIGRKCNPPPPPKIEAIAKGVPSKHFKLFVQANWYGTDWKIPMDYGIILDDWYPNWAVPKVGGASKEEYLMIVPSWKNPKTWFMRTRV